MNSIQYTVRSIPAPVDKALRSEAKRSGKSLNEVTIEALQKATGTSATVQRFNDLDHLFGKGIHDQEAFDEAMASLDANPLESDFKL